MRLDPDKLEKPFRKLRKSLKNMPKDPSPGEVHDLRTRARRLEATMQALMLDQKKDGKRLLEDVAPIRKKAGKVRDMDVLTGFASTLGSKGEDQCLIRLLEHLGARRLRSARQLGKTISRKQKETCQFLKQYSATIDKEAKPSKGMAVNSKWAADATATALQLSHELAAWPQLKAGNLHAYRLKVKQLRYVLQLGDRPDAKFVEALGEMKDAIGEWHDWSQLGAIAADVLEHQGGCKVLQQVRSKTNEKFDHALSLTTALRTKYLHGNALSKARQGRRSAGPEEPVVITTAKLAA